MSNYVTERKAEITGEIPKLDFSTPTSQAVIATTPGGMMDAQAKLIEWVAEKQAAVRQELGTATALLTQISEAGMNAGNAGRNLATIKRRQTFYEKIRAALEAGYYIIPPFDCQIFALRTNRTTPPGAEGTTKWVNEAKGIATLPAGEGDYVHPVPTRELHYRDEKKGNDGAMVTKNYYHDTAWKDVEFPLKAMKPELLEATVAAMGRRIFDALGIMPRYRAADPIIVGTIKHYKKYHAPVTFFVAWWLDREDF